MTFSLEECDAYDGPHCPHFDAGESCCYCREEPPEDDDDEPEEDS